MASPHHTIKINIHKLLRKDTYRGQAHLIAPVVMLKEGVFNNILYTNEELRKFPEAWNGRDVPVRHPVVNGKNVSVADPKIIEELVVGKVFNTKFVIEDGEGKLKAEIWLNEKRAKELIPTVIEDLHKGLPVEVSTGLFTDTETKSGAITNARGEAQTYELVAHNYRPDHLAILPDQLGACSNAAGCGLNVNEEQTEEEVIQLKKKGILEAIGDLLNLNFKKEKDFVVDETEASLLKNKEDQTPADKQDETISDNKGVTIMKEEERNELIGGIIANTANAFTEEDRAILDGMSDEALTKTAEAKVSEPITPEPTANAEDCGCDDGSQSVDESAVKANSQAFTLEDVANVVNEAIVAKLAINNKAPLVSAILANEKNVLAEDILNGMGEADLKKYANSIQDNFFGIAPGDLSAVNADENTPEPMPALQFASSE